jgi:hypothetical protein
VDALFFFYDWAFSPIFDLMEGYEIYELLIKPPYKVAKNSLPMGLIEAWVAFFKQGYEDRWRTDINSGQKIAKMTLAGVQAFITDGIASLIGEFAVPGGAMCGPGASVCGAGIFLTYPYGATEIGEKLWNDFNTGLMPGLYGSENE